jgi:hypothetical protein
LLFRKFHSQRALFDRFQARLFMLNSYYYELLVTSKNKVKRVISKSNNENSSARQKKNIASKH